MARVTILQHRLLHYRVPFFEQLRSRLSDVGVELSLVHGTASERDRLKRDEGSLPWATVVQNEYWSLGQTELIWQQVPSSARACDLIVLMQENRILSNYPLLVRGRAGGLVAYWGHGRNFQSGAPDGLRERWKRAWIRAVDWWFVYTQLSYEAVAAAGFPSNRVTVVNNTVDMSAFRRELKEVTDLQLAELRGRLDMDQDSIVGLYCGSLYPDKRLDVLVQAADRISMADQRFRLVVIGDGPEASALTRAASSRPWMRYLGAKRGTEKAALFRLADVVLIPGAVGLLVLDAFCAGLPLVTMRTARHGPEIAYLQQGVNGLLTDDNVSSYAEAVLRLLSDPVTCKRISAEALRCAERYTLDRMVGNFVDGVQACLATAA